MNESAENVWLLLTPIGHKILNRFGIKPDFLFLPINSTSIPQKKSRVRNKYVANAACV